MTTAMKCPVCNASPLGVLETRGAKFNELRRVRQCPKGHRFSTFESIDTIIRGADRDD